MQERLPDAAEHLAQGLLAACARHPHALALSGNGPPLSYQALALNAQALAKRLGAAGLQADEPVHVWVSNQSWDIAALFGVWLAGGVAVPVHRSTPAGVQAAFTACTQARWAVDPAEEPDLTSTLPQPSDRAGKNGPPPQRTELRGAALVVFTSGSTGAPKGVVIGHRAFAGKLAQIDRMLHFQPGERTLLVLNITFSFGLWTSLLTLLRGGTLVMQPKFEPGPFLEALAAPGIHKVGMVPTMMRVLFADPRWLAPIQRLAAQGWPRQVMIGGESLGQSLSADIRRHFAQTELVDIYGLTETATCDFFAFPADFASHPGCIGRPAPGEQYRIVDSLGQALPTPGPGALGAVGELQIQSPYAMNGYLGQAALSAAAHDGPWFRTGDLARCLDGGERGPVVQLMGRIKQVISRGGNKVTPMEIEQALCAHPDVAAAMAVGIEDPVLGQRIHALLVPRSAGQIDWAGLRPLLLQRLERYKHPDAYHLADALPLGRTGKADPEQLKAWIGAGELRALAPP